MPIRFRCRYCNRLLGIATRKAGTETACPHCGNAITVPVPTEEEPKTERLNLEDVDQLLGNHATERMTEPGTQVLEPPKPQAPKAAVVPRVAAPKQRPEELPAPKPEPQPLPDPDDPPLFEKDVDDLFGQSLPPVEEARPKPPPAPEPAALSLDDAPRVIVLSAQKATLLLGGVVVLLALAFAAGYLAGR